MLDSQSLNARKPALWASALLFGLVYVCCAAVYAIRPPNPDQLAFDYMAWRQLEGEAPYHGFINSDWPGVIWLHTLSIALFGLNQWSWRILDFLLAAMAAMSIAGILRRSVGRSAWCWCLILYPLFYVGLATWIPGNHDMAATHFACAALWFHQRALSDHRTRSQWGAGALLGLATLCKPTFMLIGIFLLIQTAITRAFRPRLVSYSLRAGVAVAGIFALALIALLLQGTTLGEVWDCTVRANAKIVQLELLAQVEPSILEMLSYALTVHLRWWTVLTAGALIGAYVVVRAGLKDTWCLFALWAGGLCSFLVQRKVREYQLAPLFPPVVGLMSTSLSILSLSRLRQGSAWKSFVRVGLIGLVLLAGTWKIYKVCNPLLRGGYSQFLAEQQPDGNVSFTESLWLADQIRTRTSASDTVFVLGYTYSLSIYSHRAHPTALFYYETLFRLPHFPMAMGDRWLAEWQAQLHQRRPRLCIIQADFEQRWLEGGDRAAEVLREFLYAHYKRTGPFGPSGAYTLYELRQGGI